MISQNESCGAEQISTSYLRCLLYLLEDWCGTLGIISELPDHMPPCTTIYSFVFPAVTFILVFICAIIVHIYKRKTDTHRYMNDFWDGVKQFLATVWYVNARIWNGYEVHGLEKIPEGSAMIVHYHGATFLDFVYLVAIVLIRKKKNSPYSF